MDPLDEVIEKAAQVRHQLHALAEESLRERETAAFLAARFREAGVRVRERDGWFWGVKSASVRSGKKPIAFVADLDALPIPETLPLPYASRREGVSHKCGHDGHMAALYGLALALENRNTDRDVYFILEPGEEIGAGGEKCSRLIPEMGIGEVYAFHNRSGYPLNAVACRPGEIQCASCGLTALFAGRPSHASEPEKGANPALAAAGLLLETDRYLHLPHDGLVLLTPVHVRVGKRDFGVNPGDGEVSMTLRAEKAGEMRALEAFVRKTAGELAAAAGLEVTWEKTDEFPETANWPESTRRVRECADRLGLSYIPMDAPWRASEDFGYYTRQCPGAIFYLGNGEDWPDLHTREYDFNDAVLPAAVGMFLALAGAGDPPARRREGPTERTGALR